MDVLEKVYSAFCAASTREGSLKTRLASFHSELIEIVPPINDAYAALVERFQVSFAEKNIPTVGDEMPGFMLPNDQRGLTTLQDLLEHGPCIISFNRGNWCFHCMLELHALAAIAKEANDLGARLVSIVPERQPFTRKIKLIGNLPFPVLSDIDNGVAASMDLLVSARHDLRELFLAAGLDLATYQGNDGWFLPIPATFIVDQDGIIRSKFIDPDFRTRAEPDDVVAALRSIASPPS